MSGYFVPKEYLFEQTAAADVWVIDHSCGYPSVDVSINENGKVEKMIPFSVKFVSKSRCEIHFTRPFAGIAKLVG